MSFWIAIVLFCVGGECSFWKSEKLFSTEAECAVTIKQALTYFEQQAEFGTGTCLRITEV